MFIVRRAENSEVDKVRLFYHSLIESMQDAEYKPAWEKEVYPTTEFIRTSINNGELHIGELDGEIASAMVVNHSSNESYHKVKWPNPIESQEILVIHALGVHTDFAGKGLAKEMVKEVFSLGSMNGMRAIRLDVLQGNVPAQKLYVKMGFKYIDTIEMFYEDTGWTNYELYEYLL